MTMTPERIAELDAVMAMLGKAPLWKTGQWFERNAADIRAHIDAQAATIARLTGAAKRSLQGWENAIELGLIPHRHTNTATILADELRAAITKIGANQ